MAGTQAHAAQCEGPDRDAGTRRDRVPFAMVRSGAGHWTLGQFTARPVGGRIAHRMRQASAVYSRDACVGAYPTLFPKLKTHRGA
jgi:hypothetical protein